MVILMAPKGTYHPVAKCTIMEILKVKVELKEQAPTPSKRAKVDEAEAEEPADDLRTPRPSAMKRGQKETPLK